jgi:iron complex outermembrane recepter protein
VDDEVRQLGAGNIARQCILSADYPDDPLCDLVTRDLTDPNRPILEVNDSYVNVAKQIARGIDVSFHYRQEFRIGTFTFDADMVWALEDTTQLLGESEPEDFNGSTFEPDFTAELRLRYDKGDWTVFWDTDILSKASDTDLFDFDFTDVHPSNRYSNTPGVPRLVYYKQFTEAVAYHNVSVRRKFDTWTLQAGVRNLFDEHPAALSGNAGGRIGYSTLASPETAFKGRTGWLRVVKTF